MLIYDELKNKPRAFLAATGLKVDEFEQWLPAFQTAYKKKYPPELTQEGKTRQRQVGGGATGASPPTGLATRLTRPRGGSRARRGSCGNQ